MKNKGILLIHGAGLSSTVWKKMQFDWPFIAADFPNRGDEKANLKLKFDDYVKAVIAQAEAANFDELVIVAHALGGCVGLAVAKHFGKKVIGFIAVTAAIPENGKSFASCLSFPKNFLLPVFLSLSGTKPSKRAIKKGLANGLSEAEAEKITTGFTPEAKALYTQKCNAPIPDTLKMYIMTEDDTEFLPDTQHSMMLAFNPQNRLKIKSGHLPMLSHPEELSEIINECCGIL
jgi:pimeloyl-ACP methyl ester carboxylesterase